MEAMLGGAPGGASRGHERVGALEAASAADLAPPSEIGAFIASHRSCDAYECAATPNPAACCVDRASAEGRSADSVYNALADDAFACVPDPALAFASSASHAGCYARVAAWASFVKALHAAKREFPKEGPAASRAVGTLAEMAEGPRHRGDRQEEEIEAALERDGVVMILRDTVALPDDWEATLEKELEQIRSVPWDYVRLDLAPDRISVYNEDWAHHLPAVAFRAALYGSCAAPRGNQIFNPTSMCAYATVVMRALRPCFENSTRAIDASKNQPNRLRFYRDREVFAGRGVPPVDFHAGAAGLPKAGLTAWGSDALLARVESLEPLIKALSSCGHDLDTRLAARETTAPSSETSHLSSSVASKSFRLMFGWIVFSRRVRFRP